MPLDTNIREYAPELRPAARVVDTYVRPNAGPQYQAPDLNAGKSELAAALVGVNSTLTKFMPHVAKMRDDDAEKTAKEIMDGMTWDEAMQKQKEGKLLIHENPYVNQHLNIHYGQKLAEWRQNDLTQRFYGENTSADPNAPNVFDRNDPSMTAEKWVRAQMQDDLKSLQGQDARLAYGSVMDRWMPHLIAADTKEKADLTAAHAADAAYDNLYGLAKDSLQAGGGKVDASAVHTRMRDAYPQLQKVWSLTPDKLDGVMLRVAKALAEEGQLGLVNEILNGERKGANGEAIPALSRKADVGPEAVRLLDHAQDRHLELARSGNWDARVRFHDLANQGLLNETEFTAWRKANPNIFKDNEAEQFVLHSRQVARSNQEQAQAAMQKAAIEQAYQQQELHLDAGLQQIGDRGGLLMVRPFHGRTKSGEELTHSPDSMRSRAVDMFIDQRLPRETENWARQNNVDPASPQAAEWAFNRRLEWMSKNGVADPQWQEILKGGATTANNPNITAENMPPALTAGYQLFKQLDAKSPHTLGQHLPDRHTQDFYEAARIGEQRLGMGERDALLWAAQIQRGEAKQDPELYKLRFDDLKTQMDKARYSGTLDRMFGDSVVNSNVIAPDFERLSKLYVKLGLNSDDAMKTAAERLKDQFVNVNGWLVNGTDGRIKAFPSAVQAADPNAQPVDFQTAFKGYLEDWAGKSDGKFKAGDIGVWETNPGVYLLVGKSGLRKGQPLIDSDAAPGSQPPLVRLEDILASAVQRQASSRSKVDEKVQKAQAGDPLFRLTYGDLNGDGPNSTGLIPKDFVLFEIGRPKPEAPGPRGSGLYHPVTGEPLENVIARKRDSMSPKGEQRPSSELDGLDAMKP